MSSVCGAVRPSVVFFQIEDAVCQGHRRRTYNSLWGTVERSRTDTGAPTRWAYTRCAEAHQASGGPRAVAVTGPGQASGCRWRLEQQRSSPVVACRSWPSESRPVLHCSSLCGTSRRRGQVLLPTLHRANAGPDEVVVVGRNMRRWRWRLASQDWGLMSASLPAHGLGRSVRSCLPQAASQDRCASSRKCYISNQPRAVQASQASLLPLSCLFLHPFRKGTSRTDFGRPDGLSFADYQQCQSTEGQQTIKRIVLINYKHDYANIIM